MKTTNSNGPITDRDHPGLDPDNFIPYKICGDEAPLINLLKEKLEELEFAIRKNF